jgi:hypothetical protein
LFYVFFIEDVTIAIPLAVTRFLEFLQHTDALFMGFQLIAVARFLAFPLTSIALFTGFQLITIGFLVAVVRFLEF